MNLGSEPGRDLAQVMDHACSAFAGQVAVIDSNGPLTYAELGSRVNARQALLVRLGLTSGDVVAVDLTRSADEVITLLALLRQGVAWSAVDPHAPESRVASTMATLSPAAVWASSRRRADELRLLAPSARLTLSDDSLEQQPTTDAPERAVVSSDSAAYVAFTSGTTGTPKGVVVPRRAVLRLVDGAPDYAAVGPGERFLRMAPLAFDASTFEIFAALAHGSALCVYEPPAIAPAHLAAFLHSRAVTAAWLTAGLFRMLVDERPDAFAALRQVITGGDVVPPDHVARLARAFPQLRVTNGYGPTENTTFTTTWQVRPEDLDTGDVPIGRPVRGTHVVVLREDGTSAAVGEIGELAVSGDGLASGYMGDEHATNEAFVRLAGRPGRWYLTGDLAESDADGVLRFRGRRDRQVKVRGFRIEIGEIEGSLRADSGVRDAVVVCEDRIGGGTSLAAAVVCRDGHSVDHVRERLAQVLPSYAVPSVWVELEALPLTVNGKVDDAAIRLALAERATPAEDEATTVRTTPDPGAMVEHVRAVWVEVLGTTDFDDDESFFDVGGDSLNIAVVHNRLIERLPGIRLRIVDLLKHPTVRDIAVLLEAQEAADAT